MILDHRNGIRGRLIDADTGRPIPKAFWADMDTGEYRAWKVGPDGRIVRGPDGKGVVVKGVARLWFVQDPPAHTSKPGGAPLQDIRAEMLATGRARRIVMLPGQECEYPGCHRLAEYRVGDEQMVEPEVGPDGKAYERAVTTDGHCYCDIPSHFRPPVQTSVRGVESEIAVACRPQ